MGREPARLSKLRPRFAGAARHIAADNDKTTASVGFMLDFPNHPSRLERDCRHGLGLQCVFMSVVSRKEEWRNEGGKEKRETQPRHSDFGDEVPLVWISRELQSHP